MHCRFSLLYYFYELHDCEFVQWSLYALIIVTFLSLNWALHFFGDLSSCLVRLFLFCNNNSNRKNNNIKKFRKLKPPQSIFDSSKRWISTHSQPGRGTCTQRSFLQTGLWLSRLHVCFARGRSMVGIPCPCGIFALVL
jgi:hypothetical protein